MCKTPEAKVYYFDDKKITSQSVKSVHKGQLVTSRYQLRTLQNYFCDKCVSKHRPLLIMSEIGLPWFVQLLLPFLVIGALIFSYSSILKSLLIIALLSGVAAIVTGIIRAYRMPLSEVGSIMVKDKSGTNS